MACVTAGDAWAFYEALGEQPRNGLTPVQQQVSAVLDLRQEVNSGGFDRYFRYWGGNAALIALEGIGTLLGPQWRELLREAIDLCGPPYPLDPDQQADLIDERGLEGALDRSMAGSPSSKHPWMRTIA